MKKKLIITLVALIVILLGVWIYLLLNGAPKSITEFRDNIFGKAGPATAPTTPRIDTTSTETDDDAVGPRTIAVKTQLVKLTDRPVAGATFATTSEGSVVRYAVKGTGHVYEISLVTGIENRISNRVMPQTVEAIWSPFGTRALFITDAGGRLGDAFLTTLTVNDVGETWLDSEKISTIENGAFSATGDDLLYTERTSDGGTRALARNLRTGIVKTLFTVPFGENVVLWDLWKETSSSTHYVYTKPASGFNGYLYGVKGTTLTKIDGEKNLSALRIDSDILMVNKNSGKGPYSMLLNTRTGTGDFLSIETLREKCGGYLSTIWCGTSVDAANENFPIAWYQGIVTYADSLYKIHTETGRSQMVLDPETLSRERIDITDLHVSPDGPVLFKNKKDDSLWLFNPL